MDVKNSLQGDDFHWKPEVPHSFYEINGWHSILMAITGLSLYIAPLIAAYFLLQLPISLFLKIIVTLSMGTLSAIGNVLLSIFTHEAAHYSLFKQRNLNQIAGIIGLSTCLSAFLSCMRFFELHSKHHKYFHTENDPEDIFIPFKNPKMNMKILLIGMKNTVLFLFKYSKESLIHLFNSNSQIKPVKHKNALFVFECLYYFLCLGIQIYFMWLFPPLIIVYFIANIISLVIIVIVGHASHEFNSPLHFKNKTISKWIGKFFLKASFGTFLHLEHHAYPSIPAYQLPALSRFLFSNGFYTKNQITLGSVHLQIAKGEVQ